MSGSLLRKIFFRQRDHKYANENDEICRREAAPEKIPSTERAIFELELETRSWIREFKSKNIIAWIALVVSLVSLTLSIRTCNAEIGNRSRAVPNNPAASATPTPTDQS